MVSSRAAGPDLFPSCSIALVPQPDPTNTRGGAGPRHPPQPLPGLHMRQQPCMLREAAEREPRPGRVCEWEGPLEAGKYVGKLRACFLLAPPFPCFSLSVPAVTELRGFNQPCAESGAWHARSQTTDEAGRNILFFFFLAPISQETFRACLVSP